MHVRFVRFVRVRFVSVRFVRVRFVRVNFVRVRFVRFAKFRTKRTVSPPPVIRDPMSLYVVYGYWPKWMSLSCFDL